MPYGRRSSDTDKARLTRGPRMGGDQHVLPAILGVMCHGSEITVVSGRAMGHVQTESGQRTGVLRVITDVV